jgi:hypothetical protein
MPCMSSSPEEPPRKLGRRSTSLTVSIFIFIALMSRSHFFRFLYTLFIAVDANFKLKSKDRGIEDIELSAGGGCFVETDPYEKHLEEYGVKAPEVGLYMLRVTNINNAPSSTHVIPITRQSLVQISPFQVTRSTEPVLRYVLGMLWFVVMVSEILLREKSMSFMFLYISKFYI